MKPLEHRNTHKCSKEQMRANIAPIKQIMNERKYMFEYREEDIKDINKSNSEENKCKCMARRMG